MSTLQGRVRKSSLPVILSSSASLTPPFAFLIPKSVLAVGSLELPCNKKWCDLNPNAAAAAGRDGLVVRLDFTWLRGRRGVCFGSSRGNDYVFPANEDVAAFQFRIHFEMHSGTLLVTDLSEHGTLVADYSSSKTLRQLTWPLLRSTTIKFGKRDQYHFELLIGEDASRAEDFRRQFTAYVSSLGQPSPRFPGEVNQALTTEILAERFALLHEIGNGAFGVVHACLDMSTGGIVAVKQFSSRLDNGQRTQTRRDIRRARAEIALQSGLNHPNIVSLVHASSTLEETLLVTEFVPRGSLYSYMQNGPDVLSLVQVRLMAKQCLSALEHLHSQRIIHHDLKPENILVSWPPFGVKLCDFGLARCGIFLREFYGGTAEYMAPEVQHSRGHDARVDIWSLGVVLLNASGTLALDSDCYNESDIQQAACHVPDNCLADLVREMLDPDWRFRPLAAQCLHHAFFKASSTEWERPQVAFQRGEKRKDPTWLDQTCSETSSVQSTKRQRQVKRLRIKDTDDTTSPVSPHNSTQPTDIVVAVPPRNNKRKADDMLRSASSEAVRAQNAQFRQTILQMTLDEAHGEVASTFSPVNFGRRAMQRIKQYLPTFARDARGHPPEFIEDTDHAQAAD